MRFSLLATAVACLVISMGCGKGQNLTEQVTPVTAPAKIDASFRVETDAVGKITLSIHKSSLEKEFLLQGAYIDQTHAPTGESFKSRIVAFRKIDGKLRMLETNQGHVISNDLPKTLLLASFPIVSETEDRVRFDFNDGMLRLLKQSEITTTKTGHEKYSPQLSGYEARQAYLERATVLPENHLEVRQIIQSGESSGYFNTVEVRYFVTPYRPDPDYKKVVPNRFDRVGFFSTYPVMRPDGYTEVYSTRFAPGKKITFAISSNTPADYREAVRDGILYWNRILPGSPIEVIDAPEGVTAPDIRYNLIQWVNNDFADSAYADIQTDPRTGQILRGNAFITSTFAFGGIQQARKLYRYKKSNQGRRRDVELRGFEGARLCEDENEDVSGALPSLVGKTGQQILKIGQDRIRGNVSHEVGHILGLRHNFAASAEPKNYPWKERAEIYQTYLETSKVPAGVTTASSVMDYPRFQERVMLGNIVAQKLEVLEYDRVAIQALYEEKSPGESSPLYCTDEEAGKIANCDRHDFGSTVAETAAESTRAKLNSLPADIIEAYLAKVAPTLDTGSKAIESVSLLPKESHGTIFNARNEFYSSLGSSTASLRHQLDFPYFGPLNEEKTKKRRFERMAEEINATGGLTEVLPGVPRTYFAEVLAKMEELLKDENYLTGYGESGQPYTLASQDIATILENSGLLLKELEPIFVDEDLESVQKIPSVWKVEGGLIESQIRDVYKNRIDQYVFEAKGTLDKVTIADPKTKLEKVEVSLPVFYYKSSVREKASKLLDAPKASAEWASADRRAFYDRYLAQMTAACGNCDFVKVKPSDLEVTPESEKKKVVSWFKENQSLLDNFR